MRIIGGNLKGSNIFNVSNKNIRPLKDLARESIFNLLAHSKKILFQLDQSNILDLYSGTGSFGLECLSRDAKNVYFVEKDEIAIKILKKNIKKLNIENKTKIFHNDVFETIEKDSMIKEFNLIFCDPPFKNKNIKNLIELIFKKKLLKENGIIVIHRNKRDNDDLPVFFQTLENRSYGISKIIFGKFLS
tara:strand:- start:109 stop:675 length:567 start_codon:yes stop_codon:yes gene_type:complete